MIKVPPQRLPKRLHQKLRSIVPDFADIFRVRMCNEPPVDVLAMKIKVDGAERSVHARQRTYAPAQVKLIKKYTATLPLRGLAHLSSSRNQAQRTSGSPPITFR